MADGDAERPVAVVEALAEAWARFGDGAAEAARSGLEAALLDAQRRADPIAEALLLRGLADLTRAAGRLDDAARWFERAAAALQAVDAPVPAADAALCAADVLHAQALRERAAAGYAAAQAQFEALDDRLGVAHCQFHLAALSAAADRRAAEDRFARAAVLYAE
ncbi:MAG: hypothetical protein SF182_18605 [Deltaproteobacteria bacterium]|nr:hypothetical protein [Deltaproteobacteria bacterium]